MGDSLGDRVKRYEAAYNQTLTPRMPVIIRVDGRAFHTYTKGCERPFDHRIIHGMTHAAIETAQEMQGFKLAYAQSDECTFLITDFDDLNTQGWFGYELNKVVSLAASIFTGHFNSVMSFGKIAAFDARAFNVPADDVPNVFVWRQRDWERNSLQMLAHYHFSHKQLHGKKRAEMHEMLHGIGVNWADCSEVEKNGTFVLRGRSLRFEKANYERIAGWIDPDGDEGLQRLGEEYAGFQDSQGNWRSGRQPRLSAQDASR